jgi:AcrR family transcriptional regulator
LTANVETICTARKRVRDASATREAILEAARTAFTRHGYGQTGVREIARDAGVTAAMVNRYFGSKEALFCEVLDKGNLFTEALRKNRAAFGETLAREIIGKRSECGRFDPILVVLRSIGDVSAVSILRDHLVRRLAPFIEMLDNGTASVQAEMVIAILSGFDLLSNVIKSPGLAGCDDERLIAILGAALQYCIDPPAPSAHHRSVIQ